MTQNPLTTTQHQLLTHWAAGDDSALANLLTEIYNPKLLPMARGLIRGEKEPLPEDVVHGAFQRLQKDHIRHADPDAFFKIWKVHMDRTLKDYHRQRKAKKRNEGEKPVSIHIIDTHT